MRQWRLIYDQPTLGARNMAVDEAILGSVSAGDQPPTLRLYRWIPPCLSLGYGQRSREADLDRLSSRGWDIVRRPTGGRAILHIDELTYSLALPIDHPLAARGIVESYRRISEALISTLTHLGARPHAERADSEATHTTNPVCFETPSHYEITVDGRKLVGSAQVRRKAGILQHGTLPLTGDLTRICDVLAYPDDSAREAAKADLLAHAITLEGALGRRIDWQQAADSVAQGFAQVFEVDLVVSDLIEAERAKADQLTTGVYANPDWTFRR